MKSQKYTLAQIIRKVKDIDLLGKDEIRFIAYGHRNRNGIQSPHGNDILNVAEFQIHDDVYGYQGILTPKGNVRAFAKQWFQKYAIHFHMEITPIDRPTGVNANR